MKKLLYSGLIVMMLALAGFSTWFVLSFGNSAQNPEEAPRFAALTPADPFGTEPQSPMDVDPDSIFVQNEIPQDYIARISPYTRMIYDYYHSETGGFDTVIEYPAHFLLDMTYEELVTMFADWQVLYFSAHEVHLRQNAQVEYRLYVIGVHEGYIAVFYDDEYYSIKELTSRPITALAAEEQQRLKQGIRVTGAEELLRALEDFSS